MRYHLYCVAAILLPALAHSQTRVDSASSAQLVQALQGEVPAVHMTTRSLTARAPDPATHLCIAEENQVPPPSGGVQRNLYVSNAPKVDLNIRFAFDSAKLVQESLPLLDALGAALSSPDLQGQQFVVAGHTDRRGADAYNERLSCERALAVRNYLMTKYAIAPARLVALGFGATKPADDGDPASEINRRVEIRKF